MLPSLNYSSRERESNIIRLCVQANVMELQRSPGEPGMEMEIHPASSASDFIPTVGINLKAFRCLYSYFDFIMTGAQG